MSQAFPTVAEFIPSKEEVLLTAHNKKIEAIKGMRARTGAGLEEAKSAIEKWTTVYQQTGTFPPETNQPTETQKPASSLPLKGFRVSMVILKFGQVDIFVMAGSFGEAETKAKEMLVEGIYASQIVLDESPNKEGDKT